MDIPQGFEIEQTPQAPVQQAAPQDTQQSNGLPPGFEVEGETTEAQPQSSTLGAAAEGIGRGLLGPLATAAETSIGHVLKSDIRQRAAEHPIASGLGEAAGLVGGALAGTGEAAIMDVAGNAAAHAMGLGSPIGTIAKIGSSAVKQAAEMAVMQSSDETSKMIMNDPDTTAETALGNIGMAAALGAGTGAFVTGALSPLWKASSEKLGGALSGLKMRLNGETSSDLFKEAQDLGLQLKPEVAAAMSEDKFTRNIASKLSQTDTTSAGRGYQASLEDFKKQASDNILAEAGKTPEIAVQTEINKYDTGKELAHSIADRYEQQISPSIKAMEESKLRLKDEPLIEDAVSRTPDYSNPYNTVVNETKSPGTNTQVRDAINTRAVNEGWVSDANSDIARAVNTANKDIQSAKTLGDLVKISENIGKNTRSTLPFGQQTPLSRAGAIIKDMIEDKVQQFAVDNASARGLTDQVNKLLDAKQSFSQVAKLKNALDERLHTKSTVSGFAKALREMGTTDGESVLNRLSGSKDANILDFLHQNYPEAADKLRNFHMDNLVKKSMKGEEFNSNSFVKNVFSKDNVSPQMRDFLFDPAKQDRIQRLSNLANKLNDANHNFSNTARTIDKLHQGLGGSALGAVGMLMGHGSGLLLGPLAEIGLKEGLDHSRLAMLRFLASEAPVNPSAFKQMTMLIGGATKGAQAVQKAAINVLKPGAQVAVMKPLQLVAARDKLDKQVTKFTKSPEALIAATQGETGHYLPGHQVALTQATTRNIQYLQQLKPQPKQLSPLDKPQQPSKSDITRYNRALDIANDPTTVMQAVKDGTVTVNDLKDMQAMWPKYYQLANQQIANAMTNHISEENPVPYKTRMGMSLFMDQAMDSTMHPQNIQAAQMSLASSQQPQQQGKPKKGSPSKIGDKTNNMYKTPNQAAEGNRSDRD